MGGAASSTANTTVASFTGSVRGYTASLRSWSKVRVVPVKPEDEEERPTENRVTAVQFYQRREITDANIEELAKEGHLGELSWFEFLVHTELCTMNYDCLSLLPDQQLQHLIRRVVSEINFSPRMMENFRVPQTLKKSSREIIPFIYDVHQLMHEGNSYHNFCHITDVTQYMYTLLLATHVAERLAPIEVAAAFIGAVCHDLDHPGLSNAYQNSTESDLSLKYDGDSPLENHHLSQFERLAMKHELLNNIEDSESLRLHEIVSNMILATDMAKHGMLMKKIKEKLAVEEYNPLMSDEGVNLLLQIALKCSDISNQARPWKVANRWNVAVYGEFYVEGDLDRAAGRKVAPLYDRASNQIPKSTAGFISFLVAPLYEIYVSIMKRCATMDDTIDSQAVEECLVFLHKNKERYQRQAAGQFVDENEEEEELKGFDEQLRKGIEVNKKKTTLPGPNGDFQNNFQRQIMQSVKMAKKAPEPKAE